jgi:imidazolonepropionase-like amidohydrolase
MAGTDVGCVPGIYPGFTLHDELKLLVNEVGMTPLEALRSAIQIPMADLVLLDSNPLEDISNTRRIRAVAVGGRLLQRIDLDAVLEGIATAVKERTGCAAERWGRSFGSR